MSIEVKVGQVWADKDKRRQGRQIRVERIENDFAEVVTRVNEEGDFGGRKSRIKLERFDRYSLTGGDQVRGNDGAVVDSSSPAYTDLKLAA